jgi:predicted ATPase
VELAVLQAPELVPHALASLLGVRERFDDSVSVSLQKALETHEPLHVLDNCEHVLAACASLVETLLRGCPLFTVLTTDRQSLGVAGGTTWRVPSLALPDARAGSGLDSLT